MRNPPARAASRAARAVPEHVGGGGKAAVALVAELLRGHGEDVDPAAARQPAQHAELIATAMGCCGCYGTTCLGSSAHRAVRAVVQHLGARGSARAAGRHVADLLRAAA
eukprot:CAMPEP_0171138622 /NCGR_PEP_ID=MMETSP0766_2-20121228/135370_1 /TAXON_ID=439317 /ORGANISM="Gambierdiscus australes, Strain CAWD 149" /LENGTH=108 /DNA_ID=CAMNT_0011602239 /DNA_START=498 /DNA_END=822 /DNA_ORIENTATION=+